MITLTKNMILQYYKKLLFICLLRNYINLYKKLHNFKRPFITFQNNRTMFHLIPTL